MKTKRKKNPNAFCFNQIYVNRSSHIKQDHKVKKVLSATLKLALKTACSRAALEKDDK